MEFEKKLKELEKLVEKMNSGKLSLEEDVKSFEKGIKISNALGKELNKAEEKVQQLISVTDKGDIQTKEFEVD